MSLNVLQLNHGSIRNECQFEEQLKHSSNPCSDIFIENGKHSFKRRSVDLIV